MRSHVVRRSKIVDVHESEKLHEILRLQHSLPKVKRAKAQRPQYKDYWESKIPSFRRTKFDEIPYAKFRTPKGRKPFPLFSWKTDRDLVCRRTGNYRASHLSVKRLLDFDFSSLKSPGSFVEKVFRNLTNRLSLFVIYFTKNLLFNPYLWRLAQQVRSLLLRGKFRKAYVTLGYYKLKGIKRDNRVIESMTEGRNARPRPTKEKSKTSTSESEDSFNPEDFNWEHSDGSDFDEAASERLAREIMGDEYFD